MTFRLTKLVIAAGSAAAFVSVLFSTTAHGQNKQLDQAMSFKPKHAADVDYEKPDAAVLKGCKIERIKSPPGFVVYHETGRILRKFVDTNKDEKLDRWSYFKDGLEVYRDIDSNFDENLDQYRWLGPAGTRWGIDRDQNGEIDLWKVISPEEVAYESFQAVKARDKNRFARLLLSDAEIKALGLNSKINAEVTKRCELARSKFSSMASGQSTIGPKSKWVYAGNGQPASMAAGNGNQKDLVIYDHASGFFDNGSTTQQIALGSMVKVGDSWRLVELPEIVDPKKPLENGGVFFPREEFGSSAAGPSANDKELAGLLNDLAKVETSLEKAKGKSVETGEQAKAAILEKLVQLYRESGDKTNAINWQENLADSVSSAYQMDRFTSGIDYLNKYISKNEKADGLDYVKWRSIFAEYAWVGSNGNRKQMDAAQDKLIAELIAFQKAFPKSQRFTPDALVQLAVHNEVANSDEPEKAMKWYRECVSRFPKTKFGRRSAGALIRLGSFGKTFPFVGKTAQGKTFDIKRARGKIVVLHFWETWCCPESDIKTLAKLQSKYKDDVIVIGCNIEGSMGIGAEAADATEEFQKFLKLNSKTMTWIQLHAPGSVDTSPLAHQLGIATEPSIILVDREGRLVETNISISALEQEIQRERRRKK